MDYCLVVDGNLVVFFEEEEGGYGGDVVFLGDRLYVIDVDFGKGKKVGDWEGRSYFGKVGIDEFVWVVLVGVEVGDDIFVWCEEVVEFLVWVNVFDLIGYFEIGNGFWERVVYEWKSDGREEIGLMVLDVCIWSLKMEEICNCGG